MRRQLQAEGNGLDLKRLELEDENKKLRARLEIMEIENQKR